MFDVSIIKCSYFNAKDGSFNVLPGHKFGKSYCKCEICMKLRNVEGAWILKMGTIHEKFGLNSKDEL